MSEASAHTRFDPARAEAFGGKMLAALNDGALCLMVSVGHRTGLFDAMSTLGPSTSAEIASHARRNERYVREWLGAMVTAKVVEIDPAASRFSLPTEHAAFLTRQAGPDNMATFTQYIAMFGRVEDDIVECFEKGGGVPYSKYPRLDEVMAEESGQTVLPFLESHILPLVPRLTDRLAEGLRGLDVGCGRGRALNRLAELYPNSRFTGIDLSRHAIDRACADASRRGLTNVEFIAADLGDFDQSAESESADLITTFDAIHDQGRPLNVLKGIYRALKSDGAYLMQDIGGTSHLHEDLDNPIATFLYTCSCMHCMTVSLAQGGEGLGTMWGEEKTREYLRTAGFRSVAKHRLPHDIQNNWYVVTK